MAQSQTPAVLSRAKGLLRSGAGSLRYAEFLKPGPAPLAYVGWTGHGNLGDEAMYIAHQHLLGRRVVPIPASGAVSLAGLLAKGGRVGGVVLGGGTLIYNGYFREMLSSLLQACPDVPRFMLGVGVEDPTYTTGRRQRTAEEVVLWRGVLEQFETVRVRGPLSQAALAADGVRAEVTGDPALVMPLGGSRRGPAPRRVLGLNIGVTDDLWGEDEGALGRVCTDLVRTLVADGWRVQLITTTDDDAPVLQEIADAFDGEAVVGPNRPDMQSLMSALASCSVVVAEKLHAVVLAARIGIPGIALEYRPKCRDFQESVGRGEYVMRTDALDLQRLAAMVREVESDRERQSRELLDAVQAYAELLASAAASARERLSAG